MEVTVKLTGHAKRRMKDRFSPPLRLEDVAEALRQGKMFLFDGGCYFKHQNVGLILRSRLNAKCNFYVITVLNLKRNSFRKPILSPPNRSPFESVVIL